ncbi:GGDEF domain-containing protein [Massilia niabensis]|uniref:diguanylate cyclase n=1 Tax=Massilia niabensis TaxID=544910 RepID=A0ABW0L893_9BURK
MTRPRAEVSPDTGDRGAAAPPTTGLCPAMSIHVLSALILLLVTTAMSVVMLLVLTSLKASRVVGVKEWRQANAIAVLALLLFAARGALPDLLTIEGANGLFLVTIALMYAGFRRHLGLPVQGARLLVGGLLTLGGVAAFHYGLDSIEVRTVSVSMFHGTLCLAIGASVPVSADARLRYPTLFTKVAALALGTAHGVRGLVYAIEAWMPGTFDAMPTYNLVFMALGTLALPALTLGAVMMANARILAAAAHAADHDHLTGAASRRAFSAFAEREHARAQGSGSPLALLLFDVDHFKRINDSHGHGVGDRVLREIVERTREAVREVDYCGRLGGEEFAVLLPDTDAAAALAVAERVRAALDTALEPVPAGQAVCYTVSIGVAMLEEGEALDGLMARADAALYKAKAGGRNRVVGAPALHPHGRALPVKAQD